MSGHCELALNHAPCLIYIWRGSKEWPPCLCSTVGGRENRPQDLGRKLVDNSLRKIPKQESCILHSLPRHLEHSTIPIDRLKRRPAGCNQSRPVVPGPRFDPQTDIPEFLPRWLIPSFFPFPPMTPPKASAGSYGVLHSLIA